MFSASQTNRAFDCVEPVTSVTNVHIIPQINYLAKQIIYMAEAAEINHGKCDLSILIYSPDTEALDNFRIKLATICASLQFKSTKMHSHPILIIDKSALQNSSNRYILTAIKQAPFQTLKEIYLLCGETDVSVQVILDNS